VVARFHLSREFHVLLNKSRNLEWLGGRESRDGLFVRFRQVAARCQFFQVVASHYGRPPAKSYAFHLRGAGGAIGGRWAQESRAGARGA